MASVASSGARGGRDGAGKVTALCAGSHLLAGSDLAADIEDDPVARRHAGGQVDGLAVVTGDRHVAELDGVVAGDDGHLRAGGTGHEGRGWHLRRAHLIEVKADLDVEAGQQDVVMVGNVDLDAQRSRVSIDGTGAVRVIRPSNGRFCTAFTWICTGVPTFIDSDTACGASTKTRIGSFRVMR